MLNLSQSLKPGLNLGALLSVEPRCLDVSNSHCPTNVHLIIRNIKKQLQIIFRIPLLSSFTDDVSNMMSLSVSLTWSYDEACVILTLESLE